MGSKLDALNKLSEGSYGTEGETIDWSYWDTAVLAVATLQWRMFTAPIGGAAGRTLADTNMTTSGMIPQAQYFEVHALKVFYTTQTAGGIAKAPAAIYQYYDLLNESTLEVRLTNKANTGEWALDELLGFSSKFAVLPAAGDNVELGEPRFHGIYPLKNKLVLAAMTPFEVRLTHHVAVGALLDTDRLKISMAGILTRAT